MESKKKFVISGCLGGDICRYNGEAIETNLLKEILKGGLVVKVCPEVDGGLPVPREPAEIVGGDGLEVLKGKARIITRSGKDLTHEFIKGAEKTLKTVQNHSPCTIILKSRSPSCGCNQIYDGSFRGLLKDGDGVTAALLKQHGFSVEDENSTTNDLKKLQKF